MTIVMSSIDPISNLQLISWKPRLAL